MALVSSRTSKAVCDFETAVGQAQVNLVLVEVNLRDAASIAAGVARAAEAKVDLIVVARGGGSRLELAPFSDPIVVRAIAEAASATPLLLAIGHTDDALPVDPFASAVAGTPTAAGGAIARLSRPPWRARPLSSSQTKRSLWRRLPEPVRTAVWVAIAVALCLLLQRNL